MLLKYPKALLMTPEQIKTNAAQVGVGGPVGVGGRRQQPIPCPLMLPGPPPKPILPRRNPSSPDLCATASEIECHRKRAPVTCGSCNAPLPLQVRELLKTAKDADAIIQAVPQMLTPQVAASVLVTINKW